MLTRLADDIWTIARPQSFLGLQLGTRMTIVRLSDGGLFIHSPVALEAGLREAIDALGVVRHIVAPNLYHHLHAGQFASAYPHAHLHGAPGLEKKRRDLRFASRLGQEPNPEWAGELRQVSIEGSLFHETVFFHERSRTLVVADLIERFTHCDHWPTRVFLRATGVYGRVSVARQHRLAYHDKPTARAAVEKIAAWPVEQIVPCHGDLISRNAGTTLRESFAWLQISEGAVDCVDDIGK